MGNCLTSTKVVAQNEQDYDEPRQGSCRAESIEETRKVITAAEVSDDALKVMKKTKKKKVVRFKLNEESNVDSGKLQRECNDGVERIRIVMTQKELKQILSSGIDLKNYSSMSELVRVMRLRGNSVSVDDGSFHGGWRPALETIPEEY